MANRPSNDPLYYGEIQMKDGEVPTLTSGKVFRDHLDELLRDGKELKDIITATDDVMKFFDHTFPELVESNQVGEMSQKDFELWKPENNIISVEFDTKPRPDTPGKDVYIGGPAALFAAALEAEAKPKAGLESTSSAPQILYGHNGSRGTSNWKGSASYYHIVDTVPVYYWPDNTGAYVMANTIRNGIKKAISPEKYKKEVYEDPNFNKLNVDPFAIAKDPSMIKLCIKNTLYTMRDVGIPLTKNVRLGPFRWSDEQAVAYTTLEHGHLTREIFEKLPTEKPILIKSNNFHRALRTHVGEGQGNEISSAYEGLKKYSREHLEMRKMSKEELEARGYDTNLVTEGGEFPYDGYFPPYMDQELEKKVEQSGGTVNGNMLLKKILVAPTGSNGDCEVTRIVWENNKDGKEMETPVNELFLSLGPSAKEIVLKQPDYSVKSHLTDYLSSKLSPLTNTAETRPNVYPPTLKALVTHAVNNVSSYFGKNNLINDIMYASALTAVLMVKVDPTKVPEFKIMKFRDHLNGHNKHVVRLAEKEVTTNTGKKYLLFALQLTGGGNFPSRHCHPEAAINAMWGNTVPVLGMEDEGVEYDVISARSCARGVTAQNVFRMTAPFRNMVKIYGIGGLGMTTMAPNAVLMKAVMEARQQLADGKITDAEFTRKLKESDFGMIRSYGTNPFSRNYAQFIDNAADPKRICRKMGVESNVPALREVRGRTIGRVAQLMTQVYRNFGFALRRKLWK